MSGSERREAAFPFKVGREIALGLIALGAVLFGLGAQGRLGVGEFLFWGGLTVSAAALSSRFGERMREAIGESILRKVRPFVWTVYAVVAFDTISVLTRGDPAHRLSERAGLLAQIEVGFLLYAGLGHGAVEAIANALLLSVVAEAAGGAVGPAALLSHAALLPCFLAFDVQVRRLALYAVDRAPSLWRVLRVAAGYGAIPVLVVTFLLLVDPSAPITPLLNRSTLPPRVRLQSAPDFFRELAIAAVVVAILLGILLWVIQSREESEESERERLLTRAFQRDVDLPPLEAAPTEGDYRGVRGKIIRLYVRFLALAAKRGLKRPPHQTPAAFAPLLPIAATRLTRIFEAARYGGDEPTAADIVEAKASAREAVRGLESLP